MFKDYYKKELRLLRETAAEFAASNPGLAGLLKESSTDPDTERLLEGFAFLTASIHRELDEQYPDFLYTLAQVVCPDYLRPMPSATLMTFEPRVNLNQTLRVPAGTLIDSRPVQTEVMSYEGRDAETCRFRTSFPVDVMPLRLTRAAYLDEEAVSAQSDRVARIRLDFELLNTNLEDLHCERLRLCLSGGFNEAADLFYLLNRWTTAVEIHTGGRRPARILGPGAIEPVGFAADETLYQRAQPQIPAFALLQEYFLFPEKYLFVDIDLSDWTERAGGEAFSLVIETRMPEFPLPAVSREHICLHATPAINLFPVETEPVRIDHHDHEIRLRVRSETGNPLPIFSVDRAESIARGRKGRRQFTPMGQFNLQQKQLSRFLVSYRPSENAEMMDTYLNLAFPESEPPTDREVLKASVTCFNDALPTALEPGDIDQATMNTPELVTFRNLSVPSRGTRPLLNTEVLWHLLSDLSLNFSSLASSTTLKTLLAHYVPPDNEDERRYVANQKRVDAITAVHVVPRETLYRQSFIRGQQVRVAVRGDYFASEGDRYLFGCLLDLLFASSAGLNTFTQLVLEDSVSGAELEWPIRLGLETLI